MTNLEIAFSFSHRDHTVKLLTMPPEKRQASIHVSNQKSIHCLGRASLVLPFNERIYSSTVFQAGNEFSETPICARAGNVQTTSEWTAFVADMLTDSPMAERGRVCDGLLITHLRHKQENHDWFVLPDIREPLLRRAGFRLQWYSCFSSVPRLVVPISWYRDLHDDIVLLSMSPRCTQHVHTERL